MKLYDSRLILVSDPSGWVEALKLCGNHDIYHLPQYHLLAEEMGEGKPYIFFFHCNGRCAALPFLLRPIAKVGGLGECQYNDITSVYGYPGVVTSMRMDDRNAFDFRKRFQRELVLLFRELSVVAFFSRTNPLLNNTWLLDGMTEIITLSTTIAIDLSKSDEEQLGNMTKGHKYDIRKARKSGVVIEEDVSFQYVEDFIQIYNETMERNNARESYYFPKDYYLYLKKNFGGSVRMLFARFNGVPISAAMFFGEGNIIQYHLSGSSAEFFPLNGAKLILEEVRRWGLENGFLWLHLGGGVGSSEDSLFRFKAGFSKVRLPFQIVKKIIDQDLYSELCFKRRKWANIHNYIIPNTNYFPEYRGPTRSV